MKRVYLTLILMVAALASNASADDFCSLTFSQQYCTFAGMYIDKATGAQTSASRINNRYSCTNYIPIPADTELFYSSDYNSDTYGGYAFYNEAKQFISGGVVTIGDSIAVPIPDDARFLRFTNRTHAFSNVSFTFTASGEAATALSMRKEHDTDAPLRKKCHVLMVGNSYTNDQHYYSAQLLNAYGVNPNTSSLSRIEIGAYMLQDWATCVDDTSGITYYAQFANPVPSTTANYNVRTPFGTGYAVSETLTDLLTEPWDIICFQQRSNGSADYSTIGQYMNVLISKVREVCSNPDVKIYYDMTQGMPNNHYTNYPNIITTMNQLLDDYGDEISRIIPVGTAVENLRHSELNTGDVNDFTRDGSHLANGAGKYVGGLALVMTLFKDMMDKSLFEDTTTTIVLSDTPVNGEMVVDETNRKILQQCVYNALLNPLEVHEPTSIPGDVNGDGIVNIADVTALIDYMESPDIHPFNYINANINEDSKINIADVTDLIDLMVFE